MRKVQYGLVVLGVFFSLTAGAAVLWQQTAQGSGTGRTQSDAENVTRSQLNGQIGYLQTQCQNQQAIALVFQLQKNCNQMNPFMWQCGFRVTVSCEK